jgi:glutamyl-tRNA reductase
MILSTCNRVEVALACEESANGEAAVDAFLADTRHVDREWVRRYLYRYNDRDAIRHLFRVAASLDSMVVGEPQILGQLKNAFAVAKDHGAVNSFMDALVTRAFSVAKRVRTETEIGANAVSVSYAAVEMAREIFGTLANKKVLLIGAGKMSEAAARHLSRCGVTNIFVTNRTRERADEMAKLFNGKIVEYDRYLSFVPEVDIVITSSAAPHFILTRDGMRKVIAQRKNAPMFLIDIAVPRNIEPTVNEVDNVFLYDIDDLQKVVDSNLKGRKQEAEEAEQIVAEEVERMVTRLKSREVVPMIVSLQEQLENLRQGELARYHGKFGALTREQEEALDQLTRSLMNKIAHGPISELRKQASQPDGHHFVNAVRKVFRLGD